MNRRSFLQATASGLILAAAPAIVTSSGRFAGAVEAYRGLDLSRGVMAPPDDWHVSEGDLWAQNDRLHIFSNGGWIVLEDSPRYSSSDGVLIKDGFLHDARSIFPERRVHLSEMSTFNEQRGIVYGEDV